MNDDGGAGHIALIIADAVFILSPGLILARSGGGGRFSTTTLSLRNDSAAGHRFRVHGSLHLETDRFLLTDYARQWRFNTEQRCAREGVCGWTSVMSGAPGADDSIILHPSGALASSSFILADRAGKTAARQPGRKRAVSCGGTR